MGMTDRQRAEKAREKTRRKVAIQVFTDEIARHRKSLAYQLVTYEATGDHDHGFGPISGEKARAHMMSSGCWACAVRRALIELEGV